MNDKNLIRDNDKIFDFDKQVIIKEGYPQFLRKFIGGLSSCELGSMYNKTMQYIASGCVPLTPAFGNIDILFPDEKPVLYKNDCSDIAKQAQYMINNLDETQEKAMRL